MTELIVALDTDIYTARDIIDNLDDLVNIYKIGTSLVYADGLPLINELKQKNKQVFLDTKLYDIPETVKRTVDVICDLNVDFITVHPGGSAEAAVKVKRNNLKILSVPLLTSVDEIHMTASSYRHLTISRAKSALEAGCDGVVLSGDHINLINMNIRQPCIIAVPGVRSTGIDHNDQKRVVTPKEASQAGADYIIMGRQILNAENKRAMVESILGEMI